MNEFSSGPGFDESAFPPAQQNGSTRAAALRAQQYGGDSQDTPAPGAAVNQPSRLRGIGDVNEGAAYISGEVVGEAPVASVGTESAEDAAEMNAEIGNPLAQEGAEEGFLEASAEQLEAAAAEEAAEAGTEEGLFEVVAGPLSETGELREAGAALETGEAGAQEELFPLLAALIPTLIGSAGPLVAKKVVKTLSPYARQGIKRLAASAVKTGAGKKPGRNLLGMVASLLESAAAQEAPGGESGAELGEEAAAVVAEAASTLEIIIGTDDRKQVKNTANDPWRRICLLRITFPNGKVYRGTGFFIGPRTLATAGHCVYMHTQGGWARKIEVSPGANGLARPYGSAVSTTFRSVTGWISNKKPECDYGCIVLPAGAFNGRGLGQFGFTALDGPKLLARPVVLSGYPGDKPQELWGMRRRVKTVTDKTLIYDIDTMGGQSGAPVYIKQDGKRYVVGIHNYGNASGNSATRVTQPVFERMKAWSLL